MGSEMCIRDSMINEPYEGFLNENDQIILELLRQLRNDPNVKQAFSAENSHSSLLKMVEKEFNKKVATQLGKYINLKKLLNSNQAFNEEFLNMLVTFLGQSFHTGKVLEYNEELLKDCLLYTSDAADEEDSEDLGGRRIIKKKKKKNHKKKKIKKK